MSEMAVWHLDDAPPDQKSLAPAVDQGGADAEDCIDACERACHTTRAAATSGRSCSEGRTVFFDGHVQSRHRAPDRRQTGRRAERVLQLG